MQTLSILLLAGKLWLAIGLVFGIAFVTVGAGRVQESVRGARWTLRLVLLPGCTIFWPWLAWLWARHRTAPVECTYHRCAVPGTKD